MIWSHFWCRNNGTFCPLIVKSVEKGVYVKLLKYLVLLVHKHVHDTLGDAIFQQDNSPVHQAAVVIDYFSKYNIQIQDWPPYSLDINPIEDVWVELKHSLHRHYPDIANTKGDPDKLKASLVEVLPEIWEEILEACSEKLWNSMPAWVASVIDAKGWYTTYWACNSIRHFSSWHRHHYKYLDILYFWFEDCIIFHCGVILIFVAGEYVHKGAHGPNHHDFCVVPVYSRHRRDCQSILVTLSAWWCSCI